MIPTPEGFSCGDAGLAALLSSWQRIPTGMSTNQDSLRFYKVRETRQKENIQVNSNLSTISSVVSFNIVIFIINFR